jgi:hypothetical protein
LLLITPDLRRVRDVRAGAGRTDGFVDGRNCLTLPDVAGHVFVSYSHADDEYVRRLVDSLVAEGLRRLER